MEDILAVKCIHHHRVPRKGPCNIAVRGQDKEAQQSNTDMGSPRIKMITKILHVMTSCTHPCESL